MRRPLNQIAALLALAALTAGCGITDPYRTTSQARTSLTRPQSPPADTQASSADPAPEQGGTIPNGDRAAQNRLVPAARERTPEAALERYGSLYVNWTARTVAGVQLRLAAIALGQARAQALQAAASYRNDATLIASGVSNTGTVVAIAPGRAQVGGKWVIVTREQTTGQGDYAGLPPTLHVTYAQVTHTAQGWVVSRWSPQN
jgi:hypothetical protein